MNNVLACASAYNIPEPAAVQPGEQPPCSLSAPKKPLSSAD